MSNIENRPVIKLLTRKDLNATDISEELDSVYKDHAPSYYTVGECVAAFKKRERAFEGSPRTGRPFTIITDQNIEAVERIVMRYRQISVCRLAYELAIPTKIVYEITGNHLSMKKASTRWVSNLLTPIQCANRVDCCQELLQESEVNSDHYFHRIVIGDEVCLCYYDPFSQQEAKVWKKPGEEKPTRPRRTRSPEKISMILFWDKYGILLTEYLPHGTAISGSCGISIIERLRCDMLEKHRGKVSDGVLLLHDNIPLHKCNFVQAAIGKTDFVELNHLVYFADIAPSDYYLMSKLNKFVRGKNFSRNDETVDTIEDYLNKLD